MVWLTVCNDAVLAVEVWHVWGSKICSAAVQWLSCITNVLLHHTTAKVPYVPAEPHTDMQFAPNRLKYLHEAGGGELGVEVECDFSANSREARGKQTKATCCVDHTAAYCAISPQVATADSTLAVAFRKTQASTGGQTHRTEHTEVMWGHPAKQTCASYHISPY